MNILGFMISDTKKSFPHQDHYCIGYHDPKSITWSWCLWWTPPWRYKSRTNMNKFRHRVVGYFYFSTQEKMIRKKN